MSKLPCLTLWQPYASLLIRGIKFHETRKWAPPEKLLGKRFVIHSALLRPRVHLWTDELVELLRELELGPVGLPLDPTIWPLGMALGTAELMTYNRVERIAPNDHADLVAGDWRPGRWAWRFDNRIPFREPRPMRGRQGIFYIDEGSVS